LEESKYTFSVFLTAFLLGNVMSRFPAEWEPQKSVWLSWPRYDNVRDLPVAPTEAVLAASYMNFLISNGQVITSALWKPGRPDSTPKKDERAQAILRKLFPSRKIVPIDAESVNLGGGGIHCITQQQPK
jgi:agmatine deiminase